MLVLTRQRDQTVMIGDDIEVTVVDVRGDKVRLGISAPKNVSVHRKEVWEQIRRENQSAAELRPEDVANLPKDPATSQPLTANYPRLATDQPADPFMSAAIDEAMKGLSEGGLPIGSVLVREGQIIGRGHNRRVQRGDPMAHAEIDCLTNAGRQKTYRDTILYSTLMPCSLCSGAVVQFGVPRVIVGESVNFAGSPKFMREHGVEVIDLRDARCIEMMGQFIKDHPELWNEDIGK
ncbi:MAG: carbon storage regulator CsrA [Tepidisphaeraceae bacterium]|jgi:cytosine deaminase